MVMSIKEIKVELDILQQMSPVINQFKQETEIRLEIRYRLNVLPSKIYTPTTFM